jgi:cytosine/adenosine deaminase-related metal-dependent hydrolase
LGPHVSIVHGVEVDDADVARLQRAGSTVVHCPRSNEALRSGRFPWATYARHGCDVALGTDSRGSSPDLDVRAELSAALRVHGREAPSKALVRAAVKGGHRVLASDPTRVVRGTDASAMAVWRPIEGDAPVPLHVAARAVSHV